MSGTTGNPELQKRDGSSEADWRYERKFRLKNIPHYLVEQIVHNHPASFRSVFPDRWVNNIYFDDTSLTALYENFAGIADRQKVRLRWYGEAFPEELQSARLEWKIRSNQLGNKRIKKISTIPFNAIANILPPVQAVWPEADAYQTVLMNRYLRSYFITADSKIRLTIDWDICFLEPRAAFQMKHFHYSLPGGVVELKYHSDEEEYAEWIMQHLPFRLSKNSKYVTGLLVLNGKG